MKRKTKAGLVWLLAFSLLVSTVASTVAVSSRIRYYTAVADVESMIPLVPEHITLEDLRSAAQARPGQDANALRLSAGLSAPELPRTFAPVNVTLCAPVRLATDTKFSVSDDNTIWDTNTRVEIFRTSYENGQHNITVASSNGDKLIAPGTENAYTFKLKNAVDVAMDYTVTVKAYCTPGGIELPVICRLSRYDGAWIAGNETTWQTVPEFDGAYDGARISPNSYVTYTLDWQWPYEGDDAMDTALGNLAMTEDLILTIEILTTAEAVFPDDPDNPDPDDPNNPNPDNPDPDDPNNPNPDNPNPDNPDPDDPNNPNPDPDDPNNPNPDDPVVPGPGDPDPSAPNPDRPDPTVPMPEEPAVGEPLPPKTGDESNPALWIALAAVSFVLLLILLFWRDKDEKNDPEAKNREKRKIRSRC